MLKFNQLYICYHKSNVTAPTVWQALQTRHTDLRTASVHPLNGMQAVWPNARLELRFGTQNI